MAEILALDWVSKLLDYVVLLIFIVIFIVFIRVAWKEPPSSNKETAPGFAAQTPKAGNNADITAAISAAINEYRKNNQ